VFAVADSSSPIHVLNAESAEVTWIRLDELPKLTLPPRVRGQLATMLRLLA